MFQRHSKKMVSEPKKAQNALLNMASGVDLMQDEKRQALLTKIKSASGFHEARFGQMCMPLIYNMINHCQQLPETSNSYYANIGGLIDHALNRTEAALTLFQDFLLKEGEELSEAQQLWVFALFSAGMLQGIGKLQIDYRIHLYDSDKKALKLWQPLLESLIAMGSHYDYEFLKNDDDALRCRLNILLAKFILPENGFAWIALYPEVLSTWLALIHEDWEGAGTLGAILVRADAIAIQRYYQDFLADHAIGRGSSRWGRISTFVDTSNEDLLGKERIIGAEFLNWLIDSLAKGTIMVNKSPLFIVPGGLLMSVDIFKLFVREHPEFKNWQAVQNGFLALNMHKANAAGDVISRFEQTNTQQILSGIVFSDYAVALPGTVNLHHLNSGKVSKLSAIEMVHLVEGGHHFVQQSKAEASISPLHHLTAGGVWEAPKTSTLGAQLWSPFRG